MPVFNGEQYLAAAIESVLSQTLPDFELILIDDGSADGSGNIIRRHAARDSRIVARFLEHRGVAAARNQGVELASGRFVAFLDADDVAEPDRLALQREHLERRTDCVALGGQILFVDQDGWPLYRSDLPTDHTAIDEAHLSGVGCVLSQGTSAISRDAIIRVGGFRSQFQVAEDLDLLLRLAEIGRLANLTEPVIRCRLHRDSLTQSHLESGHRFTAAAIQEARTRRGLPPAAVVVPEAPRRSPATESMFRAMKAHRSGFHRTARRYALRSLRQAPLDPAAWRVALVVVRGVVRGWS
jgi:glycosyltransferase involved in cell wall biosynthesis